VATVAAPFVIEPMTSADLGAAVACLESLTDRREDYIPWPRIKSVEDLRVRLARDHHESGSHWYIAREPRNGGLVGFAGFDPAAASEASEIYLDGPVVWRDTRRHGIGGALLDAVTEAAHERLGAVSIRAGVGEANESGAAFLESRGFVLMEVRRTLVCRDSHHRHIEPPEGVAIVTPADRDELMACHRLLAASVAPGAAPPLAELEAGAMDRRTILQMATAGVEALAFGRACSDPLEETAWIEELTATSFARGAVESALLGSLVNASFAEPRVRQVHSELVTPPGIDPRQLSIYEGMGFRHERTDLGYVRPA